MALDLEEQEQLDNLKNWWSKYGNWFSNLLLCALLATASWSGYHWWLNYQSAQAQEVNHKIDAALAQNKKDDAWQSAKLLVDEYPNSPHAIFGVLKTITELRQDKPEQSIQLIKRMLTEQKDDSPYKTLLMYRLSGLLFEQNKLDESLKMVQKTSVYAANPSWSALFNERHADILLRKGDAQAAIGYYQKVLEHANEIKNQGLASLIELKLNGLLAQNRVYQDK